MQKVLVQDGAAYAERMCQKFDAGESPGARLSVTCEGPAVLLGMDELLAKRSDDYHREHRFDRLQCSVLDREHLADWQLGG